MSETPEATPPSEEARDPSTMELGFGGAKIKLTGPLARRAAVGIFALVVSWGGYAKLQNILTEVRATRIDGIETKITVKAMMDALPTSQQQKAKRLADERLAALKLFAEVAR